MADNRISHAQISAFFTAPCDFLRGVVKQDDVPETPYPEIAFIGRSNVGKSSLVNAVTGRRTLAKTSATPGRTQQINFFLLGGRLMITDLPGYGYAKAPKAMVEEWTKLGTAYLRGRAQLVVACVLIDSRHGLKENDHAMLSVLDDSAVSTQVILTKADKISAAERADVLARTKAALVRHAAARPDVLLTSAEKGDGIDELRYTIADILHARGNL